MASLKKLGRLLYTLNAGPLHKQAPIYWVTLLPVIAATYIMYRLGINFRDFWSTTTQEKLVTETKLPLLVATLSPILGALITNLHRTVQTDKQIKETMRKNTSDSFITHQKLCIENVKALDRNVKIVSMLDLEEEKKEYINLQLSVKNPNRLYKSFFPKNNITVGAISYTPKSILPLMKKVLEAELEQYITLKGLDKVKSYLKTQEENQKIGLGSESNHSRSITDVIDQLDEDYFLKIPEVVRDEFKIEHVFNMTLNHFTNIFDQLNIEVSTLSLDGTEINLEQALYSQESNLRINTFGVFLFKLVVYITDVYVAFDGTEDTKYTLELATALTKTMSCVVKVNKRF